MRLEGRSCDLPVMNPVKAEDFKAEAEEEANVRLGV